MLEEIKTILEISCLIITTTITVARYFDNKD